MSDALSRRTVLRSAALAATAGPLAALAGPLVTGPAAAHPRTPARHPAAVRDLAARIEAAMARWPIPGVAAAVRYRGEDHVLGFGVTNLDDPVPVDGDTVFRVGSTTKTFTGTAIMRLAERGRLDLDRTVRHYLPDFRTADPASARVTVRQLLNHTAGWVGDFFLDTGTDDGALARYVSGMSRLPQLTAPGQVFAYNNAALSLAGRVIEVVTGTTYEKAVRDLLLRPLGLTHSAYFLEDLPGVDVATSHMPAPGGTVVAAPAAFAIPRSINPAGALISSARDQLRWARFHLGDGRVPGTGRRLLTPRSLHAMQSRPGPGGTLFVELDGVGVTWMIRPTAEGPKVIQHGGDWSGQHSGFLMVPDRDFALTVLTNSEYGPELTADLFAGDWALTRFLGLHNLPATPRPLPPRDLAAYTGNYTVTQYGFDGEPVSGTIEMVAANGSLHVLSGGIDALHLSFYRRDYVKVLAPDGTDSLSRANFVRAPNGSIAFFRYGGRLYRHTLVAPTTSRSTPTAALPRPGTLPHPTR